MKLDEKILKLSPLESYIAGHKEGFKQGGLSAIRSLRKTMDETGIKVANDELIRMLEQFLENKEV
jgi:hypothetical protein